MPGETCICWFRLRPFFRDNEIRVNLFFLFKFSTILVVLLEQTAQAIIFLFQNILVEHILGYGGSS